jgi:hypothetical protein
VSQRVRIVRPMRIPDAATQFYVEGLGGTRSDAFQDHAGYSGGIIRLPGSFMHILCLMRLSRNSAGQSVQALGRLLLNDRVPRDHRATSPETLSV